jgi:hypothetical protein
MGSLIKLQSAQNPISFKWESIPEDSPLTRDYEAILWARRARCKNFTEGKSPDIDQNSYLQIEWNPLKIRRRKDKEIVDVNHLDQKTRETIDEIRAKIQISLEEFFHRLANKNK